MRALSIEAINFSSNFYYNEYIELSSLIHQPSTWTWLMSNRMNKHSIDDDRNKIDLLMKNTQK